MTRSPHRSPTSRWLLLLCSALCLAQAASPPAEVFHSVLPRLKRASPAPILLPAHLPQLSGEPGFVSAQFTRRGYRILLETRRTCHHANSCYLGMFTAEKGGELSLPENVRIGRLTGGFQGVSCGGSCSPPTLEWLLNGVLYTVQLNLQTDKDAEARADMMGVAEDAIAAGPR